MTVAIAVPTLLAAAAVEIWVSPHLMNALSTHNPPLLAADSPSAPESKRGGPKAAPSRNFELRGR